MNLCIVASYYSSLATIVARLLYEVNKFFCVRTVATYLLVTSGTQQQTRQLAHFIGTMYTARQFYATAYI